MILILALSWVGFIIYQCVSGGWDNEVSIVQNLPDNQKAGNIKTVEEPEGALISGAISWLASKGLAVK